MVKMISRYTPLAVCSGNITNNIYSVDFGKLAPSVDVLEVTGGSDAVVFDYEKPIEIDAQYGAALSVVASDASTSKIVVKGFDYLGQPITEEVTLKGTTPLNTVKCFKYIERIEIPASTAVTITFTRKNLLGLPYRTTQIIAEMRDGQKVTDSTIIAPSVYTSTATSTEPRGIFNLVNYVTAKRVVAVLVASDEVFTNDGKEFGGLFGIPHYSA